MAGWRLAPTLEVFRAEVDALYPGRDRTSDGTIGDAAHFGTDSDHVPDERDVVCAVDVDEDLKGKTGAYPHFHDGVNARALFDRLLALCRAGKLWQVTLLIYEGKSYSRARGYAEKDYTGKNNHGHHIHVSVDHDPDLADSRKPWNLKETPVSTPAPPPYDPDRDPLAQDRVPTDPCSEEEWKAAGPFARASGHLRVIGTRLTRVEQKLDRIIKHFGI